MVGQAFRLGDVVGIDGDPNGIGGGEACGWTREFLGNNLYL